MSSPYQPLVIRALIESGGRCSADHLARTLLIADRFAVSRAKKILMRWPRRTLLKHGIAGYDRASREFVLPVSFRSDDERAAVVAECMAAIESWDGREARKVASRFFSVIERAGGRCEACGVLGSIRPLDVDHIVPQAKARSGKVRTALGELVDVDDERNLQALCTRCNRGKRDTSTFDFRPSSDHLADSIRLILGKAEAVGIDPVELLAAVTLEGPQKP